MAEDGNGENSAIKAIREDREKAIEAEKKARTELEAFRVETASRQLELEKQIKELEAKQLSEDERIKQELEDAKKTLAEKLPFEQKALAYEKTLQTLYDQELALVPDDKKELVQSLSGNGDPSERLAALRNAIKLAGITTPGMGNSTNPGMIGVPPHNDGTKKELPKLDPKIPVAYKDFFATVDKEVKI